MKLRLNEEKVDVLSVQSKFIIAEYKNSRLVPKKIEEETLQDITALPPYHVRNYWPLWF
jgi:hypothetical protein